MESALSNEILEFHLPDRAGINGQHLFSCCIIFHTAWGLNPSHYQGYLYEQKNVDMVNLVLTELDALHQNILEHNIKL